MLKEEKICNPASRRVRDAAEDLLSCILEQVDYFPSVCGAESLSSLLDEVSLLQHCNSLNGEILPMSEAVQNFRYFVVDNSTIMAILEEPLGNEQVREDKVGSFVLDQLKLKRGLLSLQDPQPMVTVLLRTCSNRSAWTMQLRQLPRHKSGVNKTSRMDPGRPLPLGEQGTKTNTQPKFFPDSIDRIPLCKA